MEGILEVTDRKVFDSLLEKKSGRLLVVHFAAPWAPQCQQMNEVMQELMKDATLAGVAFAKLDAENIPEVSQKFQVAAVPTFVFFKNKQRVDRLDGANAAELTKKVRALAVGGPTPVPAPAAPAVPKEDLNARLKKLINAAPVMLFMKGSPDEPRCGFSKQIVQLLKDHNIQFGHFDILTDEEVRQGLKNFSDWPTYPQLYSGGELMGGLDIVKEMAEAGELAMLQVQAEKALEERLKNLINRSPIMLFMKGNPDTPRCGFSKTTVGILNEMGVKYDTFDILTDDSVRQGLKKLSNWPTYPQLYVKGELLGGLDIIKEMKEEGELEAALKV